MFHNRGEVIAVDEREKHAGGRPTKYDPKYCDEAVELVGFGATDEDLARHFDVNVDTIYEWKNVHPEFSEAIKDAKAKIDAKVERSLFERAMGYSCPETVYATYKGKLSDAKVVTKHYPPETVAAIFWLKNRQPARWRDRQEMAIEGAVPVIVDDLKGADDGGDK